MWTADQALAFMAWLSANPSAENEQNKCCHDVAEAYGFDYSGYNNALEHAQSLTLRSGPPPKGAAVFWDGNLGHEALSDGTGHVWSNDIVRAGCIDRVPIDLIAQRWGKNLLGWAPGDATTFGQSGGANPTAFVPPAPTPEPPMPTPTRTMYDSVNVNGIPASATLIACYDDGTFNNLAAMKQRFPHATVVAITVTASLAGQVLDVETGDATPQGAVTWCTQTMAATPNSELTVYCNSSTVQSVVDAFHAAGVSLPNFWIADWDNNRAFVFSPAAPSGLNIVAKQYADSHMTGGDYDVSSVVAHWPGVDAAPVPAPVPTPTPAPKPVPTPPPAGSSLPLFFRHPAHPEVFAVVAHHVTADEWARLGTPWHFVQAIAAEADYEALKRAAS